jgi:hypothetical protein
VFLFDSAIKSTTVETVESASLTVVKESWKKTISSATRRPEF